MKLSDIESIDKPFLTAEDIAPLFNADPQTIRSQARSDPNMLGYPVSVTGSRVHIPKEGFIFWYRYGRPVGQA